MYTGETPHKCKQCDITSIIASHLKMHNKKDACLISGLFSHPTATHPWSVLEACRWLFQDKQREKDLSNHSSVPGDIHVSIFYSWSCFFLMILCVMMFILWQWLYLFFQATNFLYFCLLGYVCNNLLRDIIAEDMMDTSQGHMTGGPGCTVEVDESLFGRLNRNLVSYLNCVVSR